MFVRNAMAIAGLLAGSFVAGAQQASQIELKIDSTNRTISVTGYERVTADSDVAILHIGFETQPSDAKKAYADGANLSNAIVSAIKQAGIPETSIRSETQHLDRVSNSSHKFQLVQEWTVKSPPERAAEILDVAISAGATSSGAIDWTMNNMKALQDEALEKAATRARQNAEVLAKGMDVRLGALIYASNQISAPIFRAEAAANNSLDMNGRVAALQPLSIEPRKVSEEATVYAVFAIE